LTANLLCAALLILSGCRRSATQAVDLVIEPEVLPRPPRVGSSMVILKVRDAAAKPVTGARIELEGDMSHAGMAPVFGETKEYGPGDYRGRLELTMAGDWVILLHVTLPGGQKVERQVNVPGVRAN
jgi:YtkA-like